MILCLRLQEQVIIISNCFDLCKPNQVEYISTWASKHEEHIRPDQQMYMNNGL